MKVGDIALMNDDRYQFWKHLVKIEQLDYNEVTNKVKTKNGGLFGKSEYKTITTKELTRVWWSVVGDATNQINSKNWGSEYYDWDRMISNATHIIKQIEILKNS